MANNEAYGAVRAVQKEMGIKRLDIRYCGDKEVVDSVSNNVSFVMDHNFDEEGNIRYNIVDIIKSDKVSEKELNRFTVFPYPFEKYNVSDILTIPGNLTVLDFDFYKKEWEVLNQFIKYNYFLKTQIEEYYQNSYEVQSLGLDMPSIDEYVVAIINRINNYVIDSLRLHRIPSATELMTRIGIRNSNPSKYAVIIPGIIGFYINNMGLKRIDGTDRLVPAMDDERIDVPKVVNTVLETIRTKTSLKTDDEEITM